MTQHQVPPVGQRKPDAEEFGRGLGSGIGVNLLVQDLAASVRFQAEVLEADVRYWDDDLAIMAHGGTVWMLQHDRTYRSHPLIEIAEGAEGRGLGSNCEFTGAIQTQQPLLPRHWAQSCWQRLSKNRMACARLICWMTTAMFGCHLLRKPPEDAPRAGGCSRNTP